MDMQVVHTLTAMLPIVDHNSEALTEAFLFGDLGDHNHHVAEQLLVPLLCELKLAQAISVLGDHQEVGLCNWGDISESETEVVFVDHSCRNFFLDNLVENCDFFSLSSLRLGLFVRHLNIFDINNKILAYFRGFGRAVKYQCPMYCLSLLSHALRVCGEEKLAL